MELNEKTTHKDLKEYIKDNNLQDLYQAKFKKAYTRATKYELRSFIKDHLNVKQIENNMDSIFNNSIQNNSAQNNSIHGNTVEDIEEKEDQNIKLQELFTTNKEVKNSEENDDIEEIPIFKSEKLESRQLEGQIAGFSFDKEERYLQLNNSQYKVKAYITRFPDKTRNITSRPTFKKEFANLRDKLSKKEREELVAKGLNEDEINKQDEENQLLLSEVEHTLSNKNCSGMVKDTVLTTIGIIEGIVKSIRENKDNKFPSVLVNTVGQANISGLSAVLDSKKEFHDCVDELLIKYSDYDNLFMALSVEKRLCLIILFAAGVVHTANNNLDELEKSKKLNPKDPRLRDP